MMERDPIITYRNIEPSPAVTTLVHRRIGVLERLFGRIVGCEVTIEAPQKRKVTGRVYTVRLHLHLPGEDLHIDRSVSQGSARDDILLALNRAFSAAEKALKKHKKTAAGIEVKHHPDVLHGTITEIEPELGYGYLRADDGKEVYFQRDQLLSCPWEDLAKGARLKFREMQGEKGPYATAISPAD